MACNRPTLYFLSLFHERNEVKSSLHLLLSNCYIHPMSKKPDHSVHDDSTTETKTNEALCLCSIRRDDARRQALLGTGMQHFRQRAAEWDRLPLRLSYKYSAVPCARWLSLSASTEAGAQRRHPMCGVSAIDAKEMWINHKIEKVDVFDHPRTLLCAAYCFHLRLSASTSMMFSRRHASRDTPEGLLRRFV